MINLELTQMLRSWCSGDRSQEAALFSAVYPMLRDMAHKQMHGRRDGMTLQATELASEAYLRLIEQQNRNWQSRAQFYALAATIVRRVVIDYLRERAAQKRGGELEKISLTSLSDSDLPVVDSAVDFLRLDQVLIELERFDPVSARIVELRYFIGMTVTEISSALSCSVSTVERQWRTARAWLMMRIENSV